jgi:hypothetical protein
MRSLSCTSYGDVAYANHGKVETPFLVEAPIKKLVAQPYTGSIDPRGRV